MMDYDKLVEQANACHRKTVADESSWLVVPGWNEEQLLAFVIFVSMANDV